MNSFPTSDNNRFDHYDVCYFILFLFSFFPFSLLEDTCQIPNSILLTVCMVFIQINVNQDMSMLDDEEVRNVATSLAAIRGGNIDRETVLATFCNELEDLLGQTFENVIDSYKKVDLLLGNKIWVMPKKRENPERQAATAIDLAADGSLIVKLEETGEVITLIGEEVSIRLQ